MAKKIKVGVLGASGYTGADAVRLLACHPNAEIVALTANAHAGKPLAQVFPHLRSLGLPVLRKAEEMDWSGVDAVFAGLPHGTSQQVIASLPDSLKVIDLSADFRLRNTATYAEWYGHEHHAPQLQDEAVYGLTEHYREAIKGARLVACPGCYPTAVLLSLLPLFKADLLQTDDIIIDAKSGVSGAGRSLAESRLYCEISEGLAPDSVGRHRHAPEIEQELSAAAGADLTVNFTPHLVPMNRGELVTCYVRLAKGNTAADLRGALAAAYGQEPFVTVLSEGVMAETRHVRGSNHCVISVFEDRLPGRAIVIGAIDNLVKGSSGQAVQNFNLMFGLPEATGIEQFPLFP